MTDDKELKDQRVVTMMSPSELESIDDWMFKNRIRSRGEAIRRLCQMGLMVDDKASSARGLIKDAIAAFHRHLVNLVDVQEKLPPEMSAMVDTAGEGAFSAFETITRVNAEIIALKVGTSKMTDEQFRDRDIGRVGQLSRMSLRGALELFDKIRNEPKGGK